MKKFVDYIKKHKYIFLLIYWPLHFIWYSISMTAYTDSEVWMVSSPMDDMIPFCEWFIIPYVLWYAYIAAVILHGLYRGKREFLRAEFLVTGCMFFSVVFCSLIPNGIELSMRPDFALLGRDNWAIDLVKAIYAADTPARNVFPSMHTSVSVALVFAVWQSEGLKNKRGLKIASAILSVLVILATVFIKQHSVLDVFGGIGVGLFIAAIVKICENLYDKRNRTVE